MMIKYILGCLSFSVGFIGMFSIFAAIQSFRQRKQIEKLEKQIDRLDKNTVIFTKAINTLHERTLKLEGK